VGARAENYSDMSGTPGDVRGDDSRLLIPYWLRAVRIGLEATAVVLVTLALLPFLPPHLEIDAARYWVVVAVAALGGLAVAMLPWRQLFEGGPWGIRFLYTWSMADIVLVSVAITATGGASSPLFLIYMLTSVFFGAAYPPRGQVMLLIFTVVSYLTALAVSGSDVSEATLFLQLSVLATLTLLTSFMFRELLERMRAQEQARMDSERWAELLSSVAVATREMSLQQGGILDATIAAIRRLGFDGATVNELDADLRTYHVVRASGMPPKYVGGEFEATQGLVGRVLEARQTVVMEDYGELPDAVPAIREAGFRAVVVAPVWVDGGLAYTVAGSYKDRRVLPRQEVEAFEMLAQHAGLALENARRFEDEHRMVQRLAELDRLKSDFLTTVSHELRTPITVIQGVGTTLERMWGNLDPETLRGMLQGLSQNARSLEEVITTLLDYTRLEGGGTTAEMQPVELQRLVEATLERASGALEGREVQVDLRPGLRVSADPDLLDRALGHLLQNAARHTPEGTAIRIETRVDGSDVVVSVTDRGGGIHPKDLPHLTQRFYRGGDINTRPRGLGLGLALVSEMVELMGSELEVDTAPGWGSRFGFRLELVEDVAGGRSSRAADPGAGVPEGVVVYAPSAGTPEQADGRRAE
jgi:signal transduction histidine kinase